MEILKMFPLFFCIISQSIDICNKKVVFSRKMINISRILQWKNTKKCDNILS